MAFGRSDHSSHEVEAGDIHEDSREAGCRSQVDRIQDVGHSAREVVEVPSSYSHQSLCQIAVARRDSLLGEKVVYSRGLVASAVDSRSTEDLWVGHEVGSRPGKVAEDNLVEEEADNPYEVVYGLSRVHHYHKGLTYKHAQIYQQKVNKHQGRGITYLLLGV